MVGGGACMAGGMHGGGCVCGGGHAWHGACVVGGVHSWGCTWQWGPAWWGEGVCMAGKMTIAAGSTYPTGMHSCFIVLSQCMISGKLLAGLIRLFDFIFK